MEEDDVLKKVKNFQRRLTIIRSCLEGERKELDFMAQFMEEVFSDFYETYRKAKEEKNENANR